MSILKPNFDFFLKQTATDIVIILIYPLFKSTPTLEEGNPARDALLEITQILNRNLILLNSLAYQHPFAPNLDSLPQPHPSTPKTSVIPLKNSAEIDVEVQRVST